jgi:abortive infection bacteriophage resistance protein
MRYQKPPLSFEAQADLLLGRGLEGDRDLVIERLRAVNYYRLSAYWYTYRDPNSSANRLISGTTMHDVWRRYTFDRQLRLMVMDAVERVEIALRTQIVNRHALKYGPFGYVDPVALPGLKKVEHDRLLRKVRTEAGNSREDFVRHYRDKYEDERDLPLWMACELMTFGGMLALFVGVRTRMKKDIARHYGVTVPILGSWLKTLNQVRNICAHHARLWNRVFGVKAVIPEIDTHPDWHKPIAITGERMFGVLTVLYYLLKQVAPQSAWKARFKRLLADYPDVPIRFMGFPENWEESLIWDGSAAERVGMG